VRVAISGVCDHRDLDRIPVRSGGNAGACHGNQNGKGGFKLSLRGQDPDVDYGVLTRDLFGRRVNPIEPEQSLLLLKPTADVAHEGGSRFKNDSTEYEILRLLLQNAGKVLTHRQLLKQVWGTAYESEMHLLRVNISNLRRKIEPDPSRPHYLLTEPGVGYRIRV
jgi:hypothetical protein